MITPGVSRGRVIPSITPGVSRGRVSPGYRNVWGPHLSGPFPALFPSGVSAVGLCDRRRCTNHRSSDAFNVSLSEGALYTLPRRELRFP